MKTQISQLKKLQFSLKAYQCTTIEEIKQKTAGNIVPEHYYEWGNEPVGYVHTGLYLDDVWYPTGVIRKTEVIEAGLTYNCPFS